MSGKPSGPGPCIPEMSKCALCQDQPCVQYCAQCQRAYCYQCFKSEHQEERQGDFRSEGTATTMSSSCHAATTGDAVKPRAPVTTSVPLSSTQQAPDSTSSLDEVAPASATTRCTVPISQGSKTDVSGAVHTGSVVQPHVAVHQIVHPSLAIHPTAQIRSAELQRFSIPRVTDPRSVLHPTQQPRHAVPTVVHPVATFRLHTRQTVPPAIRHRPVVIQPGVRMYPAIQPKPALVPETRLTIPTGVPQVNTTAPPTSGTAQLPHVCTRHPGLLLQWVDTASKTMLCNKCVEERGRQNSPTAVVPHRPAPLIAEPVHIHNDVQMCQRHLGLPLIWFSKTYNKLLCTKCCEESMCNREELLSYGGIHNELWRSFKQLKMWEERATKTRLLISNSREQLEKSMRGLRGSVREALRNILSEVVTKLKRREDSLMIQASTEFIHHQRELGRLQSAVAASHQTSLLTQQLVSHAMLLGPCDQKFCELMKKVQDEMERAAAADRLVPSQITLPILPPLTLDQGPVNELLLMMDSLGSCSQQPPPAAPQLLMHTQGAQVLLRWRWGSVDVAGPGRCEFELQCAILPIMVYRMHNEGHKVAAASTSSDGEGSTPDKQVGKYSNSTMLDDGTVQTRCTGSTDSLDEPCKEGTTEGCMSAEGLGTEQGDGTTKTKANNGPLQQSVTTPGTVPSPVCPDSRLVQSGCEEVLTDVIVRNSHSIETCPAKLKPTMDTKLLDCKKNKTGCKKDPSLDGKAPGVSLWEQQKSPDDEQSEIPGKASTTTVYENRHGATDAEECEIVLVLGGDGDKGVNKEPEILARKETLPCTCSDLSAISICPAHFRLHLSSDEASSVSSGSPVQTSSAQTATTASGTPKCTVQLASSGDSSARNGCHAETKDTADDKITVHTDDVGRTHNECDGKALELHISTSRSSCGDGVLTETSLPNPNLQVCSPRSVPLSCESVRIVFTEEGNGYTKYRLEGSAPSTTSSAVVRCDQPPKNTSLCTTAGSTSDPGPPKVTSSLTPYVVVVPNTYTDVGKEQRAPRALEKVNSMVRQTEAQNIQIMTAVSRDDSKTELAGPQQVTAGRDGTTVPNVTLQTVTVSSRDNGRADLGGQQRVTSGRDRTTVPDISLTTNKQPNGEDTRLELQAKPGIQTASVPNGSYPSISEARHRGTLAGKSKLGTPANTAPSDSTSGQHGKDTRPEQQMKISNPTPSVPNRSFRTIYIGPAFQHSLLLETSGVVYVFRVRASNAGGCGLWSNTVQHRVARNPRQLKKALPHSTAVERATQTPEMLAHLWSPTKSPAQQKGRGKRKTPVLDGSASKVSRMDLPTSPWSSGKGGDTCRPSGGFHSRMHERLLVRANKVKEGTSQPRKSRSVSEKDAKHPPKSEKTESTPRKRKADRNGSDPPKQGRVADCSLSDQCQKALQNPTCRTPEKATPSASKGRSRGDTTERQKKPSLPVDCREAWQNLAYSTPEETGRKTTPSLFEEWHSPAHITPEKTKPSLLKKGGSGKGTEKHKTPLKVKWSFPKSQQSPSKQSSGAADTAAGIGVSNDSCVSKEDARYAVTAVTNLVDALVSWPIDVGFDKKVDKKNMKTSCITPRQTPKSTPDRPLSSTKRRKQVDPSPARRTPKTPADVPKPTQAAQKQRRAPDYFEECETIVRAVFDHPDGKLFQLPVKVKEVPDYYDIVKDPMDLDCIKKRLRELHYIIMPDQFLADMKKVFRNCHLYNKPDSEVGQAGCRLERYYVQLLHQHLPTVSYTPVYKMPPPGDKGTEQDSPPANRPVVQEEPDEHGAHGGCRPVDMTNGEAKHDVLNSRSDDGGTVPPAVRDMTSFQQVEIPGSLQQELSIDEHSGDPQEKQSRFGQVELQDSPGTVEVGEVSKCASGNSIHGTDTLVMPTISTMSGTEETSTSTPNQKSCREDETSKRMTEDIHPNAQDTNTLVSQRMHEEKSATESPETVKERNVAMDSLKSSSTNKGNGNFKNSAEKSTSQGKKQRQRKEKPCGRTADEDIGALEPWMSYRGEFVVISHPVSTTARELQCGSLQPFKSLSSPSLTTVCDVEDSVQCRTRQRSVSATDAVESVPVRPTHSTLPNGNNRHRQATSTALRSPTKNTVIRSCLSSSPHQDQVTLLRSSLQGGDATTSKPPCKSIADDQEFHSGEGIAEVEVVGVLMSENPTNTSCQQHKGLEVFKPSQSPSVKDSGPGKSKDSCNKPSADLTQQKELISEVRVQPQLLSTKTRMHHAVKSFSRNTSQKSQIQLQAKRPISSHCLVSGDEQQPITSQPSTLEVAASPTKPGQAMDASIIRKGAPLFAGKGRKRSTARKSIRMKVTDNPHLEDLQLESPQNHK